MRRVELTIRAATGEDAAAVGRMHLAAWREAYSALLPAAFCQDATEARWIERWTANLARPAQGAAVRIAVRGEEVVGLGWAGPAQPNESVGEPARDRELWALYVREAEYGTGLATRLLEAVLPTEMPAQLWVFEANPRARAFYGKHGFVPDGARHVFGPDLGSQPEIRLVR